MTHTCPRCGHHMIEHSLTPQQVRELVYIRNHGRPIFSAVVERIERGEGMKERCATKCVEMSRAAQDHINHGMKMVPAPEAMRECAKAIRTITGDE